MQTIYSCANGMATVSWGLVFGANSYRATAYDRNGTGLSCNSTSTTCQISNLLCGTQYEVLVTAISDDCTSVSNTSSLFETGEKSELWLPVLLGLLIKWGIV